MSKNAPSCYGQYAAAIPCGRCMYRLSCEYFTASSRGLERNMRHCSLDCVSDSCESLIDPASLPDGAGKEKAVFTRSDFTNLLKYVLELDRYTLEIIHEILQPANGKSCTISDLCRLHGISRQSMHRKIRRVTAQHPELSSFLRSALARNASSKAA